MTGRDCDSCSYRPWEGVVWLLTLYVVLGLLLLIATNKLASSVQPKHAHTTPTTHTRSTRTPTP